MGIWYELIGSYFEKVEKKIKEIEQQMYNSNLPGPLSMKYIIISSEDYFIYEGRDKLKDILYKLQFFAHLNSHPTDRKGECKIRLNILGQRITFYLTESFVPSLYIKTGKKSVRGRQILFYVNDDGKKKMTEYSDIMPDLEAYSSTELGYAMLEALNTSQFDQTSEGLSESIIRPASLFILLTHIPEAAIPFKPTLKEFERAVYNNTKTSKNAKEKITKIIKMTGRVPMADKIVRGKLRDVASGKVTFTEAFSEENYPLRRKGGTNDGRTWVLKDQNGELTGNLSDSESEDEGMNSCLFPKNRTPILTGNLSDSYSEDECLLVDVSEDECLFPKNSQY
ncbi:Hypothetical predicted protein [Mytilus galloprovincialis]|uniref:Uncharacterized protein n=1 Tax=Mytilus galloprovincialis TaxID=29158 RepID=A0A8B6HR72_MYTGA|nr:Hypothetical predicted protein [Mytilus galloprovincialis]